MTPRNNNRKVMSSWDQKRVPIFHSKPLTNVVFLHSIDKKILYMEDLLLYIHGKFLWFYFSTPKRSEPFEMEMFSMTRILKWKTKKRILIRNEPKILYTPLGTTQNIDSFIYSVHTEKKKKNINPIWITW